MRQAQVQTTQVQAMRPALESPARAEQVPAVSASAHVTVHGAAQVQSASYRLTTQHRAVFSTASGRVVPCRQFLT